MTQQQQDIKLSESYDVIIRLLADPENCRKKWIEELKATGGKIMPKNPPPLNMR